MRVIKFKQLLIVKDTKKKHIFAKNKVRRSIAPPVAVRKVRTAQSTSLWKAQKGVSFWNERNRK